MPELPDVVVYIERLTALFANQKIDKLTVLSPFVVRTVDPPISSVVGQTIRGFRRMGKRIVWELEGDTFLVMHLMIAGRLHRIAPKKKPPGRITLAVFEIKGETLAFTEASTKKRASLHVVKGESGLAPFVRQGIEVHSASFETFSEAITRENHTIKRSMTDPDVLSGVGNAYSDEILHAAQLSPMLLTQKLTQEQLRRLYDATRQTLTLWTDRLRNEVGDGFPEKVTAFRPEMAVHGRYNEPCPVCGTKVSRIAYAENECNYCARCQNQGRLLADRSLSRLLKKDWPKTVEEMEKLKREMAGRQ